jgi:ATP-dependent helicase/nuclease subunit A
MTRAADRLVIGGCMPGNMNTLRKHCWYDLIEKGLGNSGLPMQPIDTPDGPVKRYSRLAEEVVLPSTAAILAPPAPIELPPWLLTPATAETPAESLLRPSTTAENEGRRIRADESAAMRGRALQRGTLVHRLLQSLPDVSTERRHDAALRYLARNADGWTESERAALVEGLLSLIENARFASVFGPGSRAEVSIVGRLDRHGQSPVLVSGQIDRLVVTPSEVIVVDYKTDQTPPKLAAEAPSAYLRQLALYREVLRKLYPHLPVRAALLWTQTPELMEISAPALDAQLTSVMVA